MRGRHVCPLSLAGVSRAAHPGPSSSAPPPPLEPSQATLAGLASPQVAVLLLCFPLIFLVPQMKSREKYIYFFCKRIV